MAREFDSPWKEALEWYFEAFLRLFYPDLHAGIDWSRGYLSLDAELQEIVREAELGEATVDKLFRVFLHDGTDTWILIHVEVQSQPDADFARRMFVYYYRILDRYNRDVISLAILADEQSGWRPDEHVAVRYGSGVRFKFLTKKLLDWVNRMEQLADDTNPIASVVLAHLQSLITHGQPELRFAAKRQMILRLFDRGLTPEGIRQLYRLIDWLLDLPKDLQIRFRNDIFAFEKEKGMPYVTSIERLAREEGYSDGLSEGRSEGLLEGLTLALELKFGEAGLAFVTELQANSDLASLRAIQKSLRTAKSIEDLRAAAQRIDTNAH